MENQNNLPGGEALKGPGKGLSGELPLSVSLSSNHLNSSVNSVMFGFSKSYQILNSIVRFVTIDMMNVLIGTKRSSKMLFKNEAMLSYPSNPSPYLNVSSSMFPQRASFSSSNATFPRGVLFSLLGNRGNCSETLSRAVNISTVAGEIIFVANLAIFKNVGLPSTPTNTIFLKLVDEFSPNATLKNKTLFNSLFKFHKGDVNICL